MDTPRHELSVRQYDWERVLNEAGDVGPVVSPIVAATTARTADLRGLATDLEADLAQELELQHVVIVEPLDRWTRSFIREGATRLRELRRND